MPLRSTCWSKCTPKIELDRVLDALGDSSADAIGVNNRDLKTFEVRLDTSLALIEHIPATAVRVTESGISHSRRCCSPARGRIRRISHRREPDAPSRSRRGTDGVARGSIGDTVSLWIKICGNTSLEDAQFAAEAGADAVGFVFAPSPRRVTASQVAAIAPQLPATRRKDRRICRCVFR